MDVLNFHLVLSLRTGAFLACEAVVVGKDFRTFNRVLSGFVEDLGRYGPDSNHIKFVVSDIALPFAIATAEVFNKLELPEYMAIILFSAKAKNKRILDHNIRTFIVWCGLHADRAVRRYARERLEDRPKDEIEMMTKFFRNLRMALISAKTYEELCLVVGFMDRLLSIPRFRAIPGTRKSETEDVGDTVTLFHEGEGLLWQHLGGVPSRSDYEYLPTVKVKACEAKGYISSITEEGHVPLDRLSDPKFAAQSTEDTLNTLLQSGRDNLAVPTMERKIWLWPRMAC